MAAGLFWEFVSLGDYENAFHPLTLGSCMGSMPRRCSYPRETKHGTRAISARKSHSSQHSELGEVIIRLFWPESGIGRLVSRALFQFYVSEFVIDSGTLLLQIWTVLTFYVLRYYKALFEWTVLLVQPIPPLLLYALLLYECMFRVCARNCHRYTHF